MELDVVLEELHGLDAGAVGEDDGAGRAGSCTAPLALAAGRVGKFLHLCTHCVYLCY